ncbi:uncharacterized protein [Dermacentor albipictus]|uniref:uncharacterized protein n=1 Tax=Dermacentor albipictus TaxID=60249 RepID=UPI0038FC795A
MRLCDVLTPEVPVLPSSSGFLMTTMNSLTVILLLGFATFASALTNEHYQQCYRDNEMDCREEYQDTGILFFTFGGHRPMRKCLPWFTGRRYEDFFLPECKEKGGRTVRCAGAIDLGKRACCECYRT